MENFMNLSSAINLTLKGYFLEALSSILNNKSSKQEGNMIVQAGEDPKKQKRPKVTKISVSPRSVDSIPESYAFTDERPKVTKVAVKRKVRGGGTDDLQYDYDFNFTVNMYGNSGKLNIEIKYSDYDSVSFSFLDVDGTQTSLDDSKDEQDFLFGGLSTNNEGYAIEVTAYMDLNLPTEPFPVDHIQMAFEVVPPSFMERVLNFFRNLFK